MELVEGQTLNDKKGTISFKQAIDIGIQISEGLAVAHEKGIVHRDIKPDNIMIRKDGIVQIMDFGLAKLRGVSRLTKEGSTVGTAGYMSPEQVQGQDSDHRSDIFSLGVLLYELFTGQLPFRGVHETALMYEIVNVDPAPMSSVKMEIDPMLDGIVLECMEKDPNERTQSVKQIAIDLKRFKRESTRSRVSMIRPAQTAVRPAKSISQRHERTAWILAAVFIVSSIVLSLLYFRRPAEERPVFRTSLLPPEKAAFRIQGGVNVSLSPNGRAIAFVATDSLGRSYLYVRQLHVLTALLLPGTEGAGFPFWSPDSRFIGYFSGGKVKKIEAAGGPPVTICDAANGRGGTWNQEGIIVFSPDQAGGLSMVSASGGNVTSLTTLDSSRHEQTHRWPQFLPDGKHFLYFSRSSSGNIENESDAAYIRSLDGITNKRLFSVHSNILYANGFMVFLRDRTLMAQPFDAKTLELSGEPAPIAEQVQYDPSFTGGNFSVSENGLLTYLSSESQSGYILFEYDRSGKILSSIVEGAVFFNPMFSQDEKKIALQYFDLQSRNWDIWIYELSRNIRTRFTFDPAVEGNPIWSPDGSRIVFTSDRRAYADIYVKSSSGAGQEELLFGSNLGKRPSDWSSDGNYILYTSVNDPKTKNDLWVLPMNGDRKPFSFLQTEFNEGGGRFSADGKWVAYNSDESGKAEVYVRPFPGPGGKWQISATCGSSPRWRNDGKEIYYFSADNKLMAAELKSSGTAIEVGTIKTLIDFQSKGQTVLEDVTGDGQKFLMRIASGGTVFSPLTLVTNWPEELKRK